MRSLKLLALCLLATSAVGACAEERAPINRVDANALDKNFFVGVIGDPDDDPEFYYQPTIVDVDYGASQSGLFTASYAQTMARIRWEISEDLLIARLAYDRIDNTSGEPDEGSAGQIIAAFNIEKHFDIQRDYNPQTGEELNIIVENDSDRPWYERQYMRVDWSQNLLSSAYEFDTVAALKALADEPITYEPVAYYVSDPQSADRPYFSPQEGYFDVTNKVYATPNLIDTPFGKVPACFLSPDVYGGTNPIGDCNPVELKLRLSFKRVVDTDYEPLVWDNARMDMFGIFTYNATRMGYDRNYGIVDQKWYRFASRYNIWEQSHARDDAGDLIPCNTEDTTQPGGDATIDSDENGTQDECESAGPGSRCDVFTRACTLPYRERSTRTIPIYYAIGSDPTLWDTAQKVTTEWDGALRHAVQVGRYGECLRTGGRLGSDLIATCKGQYPTTLDDAIANVPPILAFCHNPVTTQDDPACGPDGLSPRVGDLRYHIVNIIQGPQVPSPWGIFSDAIDPLTGEVVAASINVWNAVTDVASQDAVDRMRWYNGELSNEDITSGNYVNGVIAEHGRKSPAWVTPAQLSPEEISDRIAAMDRSLLRGAPKAGPPPASQRDLLPWAIGLAKKRFGNSLATDPTYADQRLQAARDSGLELSLLTRPYLDLAGQSNAADLDSTTLDKISPLRGNFMSFRTEIERQRQILMAQNGRCMLEGPEPNSVVELGKVMAQKFPLPENPSPEDVLARNEKWHDWLRRHVTFGVLGHEMGHSMGLRHVFTSSYDALNFRPQYWQLRTRDGAETKVCTKATSNGKSCVGPRYLDPVTDEERAGMIYRWQQTSLMEYPGDFTQETLNVGAYDRAALRFSYTGMTDVWDDPTVTCKPSGGGRSCSETGFVLQDRLDEFGGVTGPHWGTTSDPFHYSQLQNRFGLIRDCRPADTSPPTDWNYEQDGNYSPELDGNVVNGTVCDGPPVDYVPYSSLEFTQPGFAQESTTVSQDARKFDPLGRVRKPYLFASDEWADIGNQSVWRSDSGADPYEQAQFFIGEYEDRHIWYDYRRNRSSFSLTTAKNYSYIRFFEPLRDMYKSYAFIHEIYSAGGALDSLGAQLTDGDLLPQALAASSIFDEFARVLTRPSSGGHAVSKDPITGTDIMRSTDTFFVSSTASDPLLIPNGTAGVGTNVWFGGRPLQSTLDQSKSYYAVDYQLSAGSYYDKTQIMELLTNTDSRVVDEARQDYYDWRYRGVSMATLFPDGLRRLLANALTQDAEVVGWRIAGRKSSSGKIVPLVDTSQAPKQAMGYRQWWPAQAGQCWPGQNASCIGYVDTQIDPGTAPEASLAIDPELDFEVQKFMIFWSMVWLPENWKLDWVDMMRIWAVGTDADPAFPSSEQVAWSDPQSGQRYIAHRYGTEKIEGKTVERGIGARIIQWMNYLTSQAYEIEDKNLDTGELSVRRYNPADICPVDQPNCSGQPVELSREYTQRVTNYKTVLDYVRQVSATFKFDDPSRRGIFQ